MAIFSSEFSTNGNNFTLNQAPWAKNCMKRVIFVSLVLILWISPRFCEAQLYVGLGMQAGFYSMDSANFPIDRYRDRGFFYKPMNHFHFPFGEIYSVSFRPDRALFELSLNTRRSRATAKSTDAQGIYQKDIRFSMQALSLGAGYAIVDNETFALYPGVSVDLGYARLMQRQGYTTQIGRSPYGLISRMPMFATSVFVKMVFRDSRESLSVWSLTPYFQYPWQFFNFQILDQVLNNGYLTPYPYPLPARPMNVGLAFNFDLDLIGFLTK